MLCALLCVAGVSPAAAVTAVVAGPGLDPALVAMAEPGPRGLPASAVSADGDRSAAFDGSSWTGVAALVGSGPVAAGALGEPLPSGAAAAAAVVAGPPDASDARVVPGLADGALPASGAGPLPVASAAGERGVGGVGGALLASVAGGLVLCAFGWRHARAPRAGARRPG